MPGGVRILVKVHAQAGRDRIEGVQAGRVKISVAAAPEKGKANQAVLKLLAAALGVPRSALTIVSGEASREKSVVAQGVPIDAVRARLGVDRGG
ncbi:MAG TPA: DUF167 family protein [Planctomycetota bacterium]|nr:DUF167 family protein [Planctomycetota bacterium]